MSGYDSATGWSSFTETRWRKYCRSLDGDVASDWWEPIIFDRCRRAGLQYYLGASSTLFVHCGPGRLWTLLSGQPSDTEDPADPGTDTQWLSVTDLGFALTNPEMPSSSVLKLLRRAGFLERVDGADVPSDRAAGLFHEREAPLASRYAGRSGPGRQRLWAFAVLEALRAMQWEA